MKELIEQLEKEAIQLKEPNENSAYYARKSLKGRRRAILLVVNEYKKNGTVDFRKLIINRKKSLRGVYQYSQRDKVEETIRSLKQIQNKHFIS